MKWFLDALKNKYATFEGRARRAEYWYFVLFYALSIVALAIVDGVVGTFSEEIGIGLLSGIFVLATFVPTLAVTVRRLHDTDRSGWWVLLDLVPFIGVLVLFVFTVLDSQPGANRFGPNPKGVLGPGTPSPSVERDLSR
jgi:uncharacterized membrane protein YhaH (DUF805 family)